MSSEHAADEAGGEVIYSYDGDEEPAVVTQPPPLPPKSSSGETDDATVPAAQAFETFAGKVYAPPPSSSSFLGAFSSVQGETTLQRLGRLQQEIQQIESDLLPLTTTSATSQTAAGADAASGGGKQQGSSDAEDIPSNLLLAVQEMKLRLARVAVLPPQETLTAQVQTAASSLLSTTTTKGEADSTTKAMAYKSAMTALESRLQRLERLTGANYSVATASSSSSASTANNDSLSFLERLTALEESLSKMDDKELELKAKKAKVIRQDLEAAAKARNKLMAGSSSSSTGGSTATSASDAKTIAALYDQLVQLHGLTPHLPLLAQRLQALARQHQEAALQTTQLHATQELAEQLSRQVTHLEQAVQTTEAAVQQTAQQMVQNMQALDERLRK